MLHEKTTFVRAGDECLVCSPFPKFVSIFQDDGTTLNVIKKGAIDFIGLPKPSRKNIQSPQINVLQPPLQVIFKVAHFRSGRQ